MDRPRSGLSTFYRRCQRIERRELGEFREWLERTQNLLHLSMLVFVPLLIAVITYVANMVDVLPFLLFPPLASGTYALFATPEDRYARPRRFIGGMTAGALCGWVALVGFAKYWYHVPPEALEVHAAAAAFGIALTGVVAWGLDVEHPSAFSTALLVLVSGSELAYVLSVAISTTLVAGVYLAWHHWVYEQRAQYLYQSTKGDDHVLVPMRGAHHVATALLGARLAAAHDVGKVVLLDIVGDSEIARAERDHLDEPTARTMPGTTTEVSADGGRSEFADPGPFDGEEGIDDGPRSNGKESTSAEGRVDSRNAGDIEDTGNAEKENQKEVNDGSDESVAVDDRTMANALARDRIENRSPSDRVEDVVTNAAEQLEGCAKRIEREIGVPCEVAVVGGDDRRAKPVLDTARRQHCDLIVTPYETAGDEPGPFVRELFGGEIDTLAHRSVDSREEWCRVLVAVRGANAVSHTMIDFAERLSTNHCDVSVCHCIDDPEQRRDAERMLSDLVETCTQHVETRVPQASIEEFLEANAAEYDLVVLGASTDRSAASRFFSSPTFERLGNLETDVAIVHR